MRKVLNLQFQSYRLFGGRVTENDLSISEGILTLHFASHT